MQGQHVFDSFGRSERFDVPVNLVQVGLEFLRLLPVVDEGRVFVKIFVVLLDGVILHCADREPSGEQVLHLHLLDGD